MGRRSSSSSSSSRSRLFASKPASKPAAPPAPVHNAAPAARSAAPPAATPTSMQPSTGSGGGLLGGIVGGVVQGMAFGAGSSIAHRAVDAVAGPRQVEHVYADAPAGASAAQTSSAASAVCAFEKNEFERCVQTNGGSLDFCRSYFDALAQCQKSI